MMSVYFAESEFYFTSSRDTFFLRLAGNEERKSKLDKEIAANFDFVA